MAAFLIYRNNSRQPSFTIVKRKVSSSKLEYQSITGESQQEKSLTDALSVLTRKLKLVSK